MVCPRREGFEEEAKGDSSDRFDLAQESEGSDESFEIEGSESSGDSIDVQNSGGLSGAFSGRIRDVLRDGADANLLLGREEVENGIFQWLQALDLQVIGGCRADERLKPLLKLNATGGAAEDQFMVQLVQHFEASEVAVLARCLCLPLVSVRVGKINKQGNMLCPTASRGFLSLTLLPSSHMRISFTGDDGCIERLALVSNDLESPSVILENISADTSGRSFLLKFPDSQILYFWCSEKSKDDGLGLLAKMKDLLSRKPSLTCLTGISKARLDSFATHLRVYILASASTPTAASTSSSGLLMSTSDFQPSSETDIYCQLRSSHARIPATHVTMVHPLYQSNLIPRSNAFKDGTLINSSTTNDVREKVRILVGDSSSNIQPSTATESSLHDQSTSQIEGENVEKQGSRGLVLPGLTSLSTPLFSLSSTFTIPSQISNQSSFFSPYYCWCPPFPTSLQYNKTCHLPTASELMPLPPLSTLLSPAAPPESLVTSKYPLNVPEFPPLKLPSLISDPLVHLSMPIPSLSPLPSSQQIATFTPFMSDPIVHIPVIDFCSSGQGYLVSAGPISTAIPTLPISHSSHQLLPPSESTVEKNARETLRLLMASTPTFTPKLFNVLPEVLSNMELCGNGSSVIGNDLFEGALVDVESTSNGTSSTAADTSDEIYDEEMEECNCSKINNCRMFNHEPDEI
ncbi:uncharacterized protein LOC110108420 [Dendrobium catenatum]|uniref:Uncharacterized protein n=1 Tax=Dendrobium catenatum TaxID=906689 RepID=A0A2I0VZN9_9ASPA|nr:uncharacterized protein LOC110108420 [Dendrobium catenatum]PKU68881.1 hypothetical protein MA16_Dca010625 [Dendrobium catenatum]